MATQIPPSYSFGTTVSLPLDEAIARVTEALQAEGFGVLINIEKLASM